MGTGDKHLTHFHKEWPDLVFVQSRAGRFQNLKTVKLYRFMVYFETGKLSNLLTGQGILGGFGQVRMSLCPISPGSCLGCSLLMAFFWWHPQSHLYRLTRFSGTFAICSVFQPFLSSEKIKRWNESALRNTPLHLANCPWSPWICSGRWDLEK